MANKVYEHEAEYDNHPEIEPIFNPDDGEYYKLVPENSMLITSVECIIDNTIAQLQALKGTLDIFNEKGLRTIAINIDDALNDIRMSTIKKE